MAKMTLAKLASMEGGVKEDYSPYNYLVRTPSPSVNFNFGPYPGLAEGCTMINFGPPEGGKSLLTLLMSGQLHQDDPEAVVARCNPEMREQLQVTPDLKRKCKIDPKRYIGWDVNQPELIFDRIEKDIPAAIESGVKIKLVVIDSINGIVGRRMGNAESISSQQIGDLALTLQDGLKRILAAQRRYRFAVILTAHVRAEMDQNQAFKSQKSGGQAVKMAAAWAAKHEAEIFAYTERDERKEAKTDLLGRPFVNKALQGMSKDRSDAGEPFAHKIRVIMKKSSTHPHTRGREGIFTWHYEKGVVNVHEEVFMLGRNRGVIARKGAFYSFGDRQWNGMPAVLAELEKDPEFQAAVIKELTRRDMTGEWNAVDEEEGDGLSANFGEGAGQPLVSE
jgi:hypothetical protein